MNYFFFKKKSKIFILFDTKLKFKNLLVTFIYATIGLNYKFGINSKKVRI